MSKKDKKVTATLLASVLQGMANGEIKVIEIDIDPNAPIEDQIAKLGEKLAGTMTEQDKVVADILADPALPDHLKAHMEQCTHCQASYQAKRAREAAEKELTNGAAPKAAQAGGLLDEMLEKLKAQHEQERKELAAKHDAQRAQLKENVNKTFEQPAQASSLLANVGALRQFRHADGSGGDSDGFVFGYDMEIADKIVDDLLNKIKQLEPVKTNRPAPQRILAGYAAFNEDNTPIVASFRLTREEVETGLAEFKENPVIKLFAATDPSIANVVIRPLFIQIED